MVATTLLALGVAGALHLGELAAQLGDLGVDPAPVGLDLGLTGAAATNAATVGADSAARLARQVAAPAAQPLLHVVELRQLDLRLALAAPGVLAEDVEDQRGPVDDLDLELVLQIAQLAGGEFTVADDGVGAGRLHDLADAVDLAAPDVRRRVGLAAPLEDVLEHRGAGGLGEQRELGHRVLCVLDRALGPHADEDHALQAELAVLDLGDVLELGAQTGDPAELVALGQVLLAGGEVLGIRLVGVPALELPLVRLVPVVGLLELAVEVEVRCVRHLASRVGRGRAGREWIAQRAAASWGARRPISTAHATYFGGIRMPPSTRTVSAFM